MGSVRSRRLVVGALGLLVNMNACFYADTTTVQLRDPRTAALLRDGPAPADTSVVLPSGGDPLTVQVTSGTLTTGTSSRARYTIEARREADASIVLHVDARLPLETGDEEVIVSDRGAITLEGLGLADTVPASVLSERELRLPRCLSLTKVYDEDDTGVGYRADLGPRCAGELTVPLRVQMPWSSVVEIRHVRKPRRAPSVAILVAGAAIAGLGGALVATRASDPSSAAYSSGTFSALAYALLAVGGGMGVLALPGLVWPTRTKVLSAGAGLP